PTSNPEFIIGHYADNHFYKELLRYYPENTRYLSGMAEIEMLRNNDGKALVLYQKILDLDPQHLQAHIFVTNYYFYATEKRRNMIEQEFNKIASPSRIQIANYRNEMAQVVKEKYEEAKPLLEKVLFLFPSSEVKKNLEKISRLEKEFIPVK
ncbi:MAG: hypothetical protein LUD15_02890, partial [Bacteroides sp.]|nr:hypothetical protein [Bacteroides sp.]